MKPTALQAADVQVEEVSGAVLTTSATGNPIPLTVADPGGNNYSAQSAGNMAAINRACNRLRVIVGAGGVVISLDGGATAHVKLPPGTMDDIDVPIAAGADIRVKRYTAGTAMTDLSVEVR